MIRKRLLVTFSFVVFLAVILSLYYIGVINKILLLRKPLLYTLMHILGFFEKFILKFLKYLIT